VAVTVALALGALGLKFAVYNMVDVHIVEFLIGALVMRSAVSDAKDVQTAAGLVTTACTHNRRGCPLLGVKRTCPFALQVSAFDP
jgi:hypothetical protein